MTDERDKLAQALTTDDLHTENKALRHEIARAHAVLDAAEVGEPARHLYERAERLQSDLVLARSTVERLTAHTRALETQLAQAHKALELARSCIEQDGKPAGLRRIALVEIGKALE